MTDECEDLEPFRQEVRAWLEDNCPASMRTPLTDAEVTWGGSKAVFKNPDTKVWLDRMGAKGWTAPRWPKEYGGGGLTEDEALVLREELYRIKARPPLRSFGIWMLGPVLLHYGTEEQKKTHLPPIVRGEVWWCQGYSEPGAGSDLAGLSTQAIEDGDDLIINGQKTWTSYADKADWIYALVRTSKESKHGGISMVLIDMTQEGVSTRPIKMISGVSPFCDTFFDNVRIPKTHVVGKVNEGWAVAKSLLQFEREQLSADVFASKQGFDVAEAVSARHSEDESVDPAILSRLSALLVRERAIHLTNRRVIDNAEAGLSTGDLSSILKYLGTEMNKAKFDLAVDAAGLDGLVWSGEGSGERWQWLCREWLRSRANSIEGGTTEINLNVIARRILNLGRS